MAFGSMNVGATGVKAYSDQMQVISNDLANLNTVGYKESRIVFRDLMSSEINTGATSTEPTETAYFNQIGKGVAVADIQAIHTQGAIMNGSKTTDMAINGKGFFGVHDPGEDDTIFYTRAGEMRFNNDGYLVNPQGYQLLGKAIDPDTGKASSSATDIQLNVEQETNAWGETVNVVKSDPRATSSVEMISNLDSEAGDSTIDDADPFFAMFKNWNGTRDTPLPGGSFAHSNTIRIYDPDGGAHDMTVYFDKATSSSTASGAGGRTYWEYMVTTDPADDGRAATQGTSSAGVMMLGSLTFNGFGDLVNQTAYTLSENASGGGKSLGSWTLSSLESGVPSFDTTLTTSGGSGGTSQTISLDFGVSSKSSSWSDPGATAAAVGSNAGNLPSMNQLRTAPSATTGYAGSTATLNQVQNGYAEGYMTSVDIDKNGVLTVNFSNGHSQDVYQVGLYCFKNNFGLRREGGNLFRATQQSGDAILGSPNDFAPGGGTVDKYGMGIIQANSLENSNVDMAREFSTMIMSQKSLQANTKVISTSDEMYKTAMGIKR
jgi:flagellar hook protein FlgE